MMKRLSSLITILAAALPACTGAARAQTTNCVGVLVPGTYANVNVPANATCNLPGFGTVTVTGNVTVQRAASLSLGLAQRGSSQTFLVNGSLLGVDAAVIELGTLGRGGQLEHTTVNILGSVHLRGTTSRVSLVDVSIGGTLFIADSTGGIFDVFFNTIGGSVLVRDNAISGGDPINIVDNTIGGSLVCTGNTPAPAPPTSQPPNSVGGNEVGQCAGL